MLGLQRDALSSVASMTSGKTGTGFWDSLLNLLGSGMLAMPSVEPVVTPEDIAAGAKSRGAVWSAADHAGVIGDLGEAAGRLKNASQKLDEAMDVHQ